MSTNAERIKRVKKNAHENDRHSGCSQGVLLALHEELGIRSPEVFKAATVLSGGVTRHGETCGALLGSLMALGLVVGREKMEDTQTYHDSMDPSADIIARYKEELKKQFGFKGGLQAPCANESTPKSMAAPLI